MGVPGTPLRVTLQALGAGLKASPSHSECHAATSSVFVPVTVMGNDTLLNAVPTPSVAEWTSGTKTGGLDEPGAMVVRSLAVLLPAVMSPPPLTVAVFVRLAGAEVPTVTVSTIAG